MSKPRRLRDRSWPGFTDPLRVCRLRAQRTGRSANRALDADGAAAIGLDDDPVSEPANPDGPAIARDRFAVAAE